LTKRNKNVGFTLLELIIVLFLVTVILGLSTLIFANALPSHRLNATVRHISATIKQARSLARIHSQTQSVTIDLDAKQYGIEGYSFKDIPSDIAIKVIDPMAGEVYEGKYYFVSYAGGNIEGGTIVLWTSKKTVSIQIDPIVGSVVIRER
jgi:type II secretory pathway pseudopilin PulG